MRKLFIVISLAVSYIALSGAASAFPPPQCDPNCPFVR